MIPQHGDGWSVYVTTNKNRVEDEIERLEQLKRGQLMTRSSRPKMKRPAFRYTSHRIGFPPESGAPSRERGLLSGVALALALALVASLLYVQPVIRAYWWIAAVKLPLHALQPAGR